MSPASNLSIMDQDKSKQLSQHLLVNEEDGNTTNSETLSPPPLNAEAGEDRRPTRKENGGPVIVPVNTNVSSATESMTLAHVETETVNTRKEGVYKMVIIGQYIWAPVILNSYYLDGYELQDKLQDTDYVMSWWFFLMTGNALFLAALWKVSGENPVRRIGAQSLPTIVWCVVPVIYIACLDTIKLLAVLFMLSLPVCWVALVAYICQNQPNHRVVVRRLSIILQYLWPIFVPNALDDDNMCFYTLFLVVFGNGMFLIALWRLSGANPLDRVKLENFGTVFCFVWTLMVLFMSKVEGGESEMIFVAVFTIPVCAFFSCLMYAIVQQNKSNMYGQMEEEYFERLQEKEQEYAADVEAQKERFAYLESKPYKKPTYWQLKVIYGVFFSFFLINPIWNWILAGKI